MRVADINLFYLFKKYDNIRQKELERYNLEAASGKKLLKPSDDIVSFARSQRYKKLNKQLETYLRNSTMVLNQLESAESTMGTIVNSAEAVRVKIVQILNTGVITDDQAKTLKDYFLKMKDYIINQANLSIGDNYVFGGVKSKTQPFLSDGTYQGETQETTVPVSKGVELNTTFNGAEYMGVNYASGKILVVDVIDAIVNAIDTGNIENLNNLTIDVDLDNTGTTTQMKLLDAFDKGLSKMMVHRSKIGSQIATLNDLKTQNESLKLKFTNLVSEIEDADFSEVVSNLQKSQTAYQALLAAVAGTKDLSLLNFIK
ncbi:flagellin [Desulfurobacterium atlanticum]|uniref:Flagellar hook-associated protein 3 FlgL n=1 Tax=Desulfurobacterium atlanticum TaxID=240169 RepID=A0A238YFQ7_9BACT|nr:flagellin [Desulfurobacterium atlanticum]SNR70055.1 flagellar hook-associated protein 3 FlgL [Desulfurobacterium atlanticum]